MYLSDVFLVEMMSRGGGGYRDLRHFMVVGGWVFGCGTNWPNKANKPNKPYAPLTKTGKAN